MSYATAAALQAAIWQHLSGALVGVPVVDALPRGTGKGTFVLIGPEEVVDASDGTGAGAEHRLTLSVISDAAGFQAAKQVAVAVQDALGGASLTLARGRLVSIRFLRAVAKRLDQGAVRRIDMVFRARTEV